MRDRLEQFQAMTRSRARVRPATHRSSPVAPFQDLVLADLAAPDIAQLLQPSTLPVIDISAADDPLQQVTDLIASLNVGTLHVVAHGGPGRIVVGRRVLDAAILREHAALLAQWQVQNIALWVCHAAAGTALVQELARLTGARVHASDQVLGWDGRRHHWHLDLCATGDPVAGFDPAAVTLHKVPKLPVPSTHAASWRSQLDNMAFHNGHPHTRRGAFSIH